MYPPRHPTSPAGTTANAPLVAITYRKEARVLRYERQLYADLGHFYLDHDPLDGDDDDDGAGAGAEADWAARREWTTQRAGIDDAAALADALAQLYDGDRLRARGDDDDDGDEDGASFPGLVVALQREARRRFGRELSRDDVRLLRDVGGGLDELVGYLAQFDDDDYYYYGAAGAATATATGPRGLKVYSDAELEAQGYALDAAGSTTTPGYSSHGFVPETDKPRTVAVSTKGDGAVIAEEGEGEEGEENDDDDDDDDDEDDEDDGVPEHRTGRFDLPAVYRHLVSPLDNHPFFFSSSPSFSSSSSDDDEEEDADPFTTTNGSHRARVPAAGPTTTTAIGIARALRAKKAPGPCMHLPALPPADAAAWQKEAVAVCRLLLMRVARRLDTVQRQLAILERPPPSSPSSSAARRARFRRRQQQQQREGLGGGSPYKSSPLAKG